jgi:H+/Cl- antiporter ClcA
MFVIDSTLLTLAITAIIAVLVASFFMWLGAKIARVERSSYGRSMVAAIAAAFVTWLISYVGAQIPSMPRVIGFVVGLVLTIVVIQVRLLDPLRQGAARVDFQPHRSGDRRSAGLRAVLVLGPGLRLAVGFSGGMDGECQAEAQ